MKKEGKFEDLLREGLQDLYDAEKQIVSALPRMIAAASSEELSGVLENHLDATKDQVGRLETIFERMSEDPGGTDCRVMRALLDEGEKTVGEMTKSAVRDAAIVAAAEKVEHYEIAGYQTALALAEMLGMQDASELLQETLGEEEEAADTLVDLREGILIGDESGDDIEDIEDVEVEEDESVMEDVEPIEDEEQKRTAKGD